MHIAYIRYANKKTILNHHPETPSARETKKQRRWIKSEIWTQLWTQLRSPQKWHFRGAVWTQLDHSVTLTFTYFSSCVTYHNNTDLLQDLCAFPMIRLLVLICFLTQLRIFILPCFKISYELREVENQCISMSQALRLWEGCPLKSRRESQTKDCGRSRCVLWSHGGKLNISDSLTDSHKFNVELCLISLVISRLSLSCVLYFPLSSTHWEFIEVWLELSPKLTSKDQSFEIQRNQESHIRVGQVISELPLSDVYRLSWLSQFRLKKTKRQC